MRIPTGKGDSSVTLFLVVCGLLVLSYTVYKQAETVDIQSIGIAWAAISSIWVGREWKKAHYAGE